MQKAGTKIILMIGMSLVFSMGTAFGMQFEYEDPVCSKNYAQFVSNFEYYSDMIKNNAEFESLLNGSKYYDLDKYDSRADCEKSLLYVHHILYRPFDTITTYFTFEPIELAEMKIQESGIPQSCGLEKYYMLNTRSENVCIFVDSIEPLRERGYLVLPPTID